MLAAELAWRDAHLTHRLTGVYATMFTAAAIAIAMVEPDRLEIFETALQYIPQRSRLAEVARDAIEEVRNASDWRDGYRRIHASYSEYGHCQVFQETATLINTLRFARDVGDGICIQVMQGNDTDSYGATAGSLLGCYFGPDHLEARWTEPFHDRIHTTLADFHEQSLSAVAKRMAQLPLLAARELHEGNKPQPIG
jgi:ADP-ribosylglycohydrolase